MTPRFTSPPLKEAFDAQVWAYVRRVPAGRVVTYGQIAAALPPPEGVAAHTYRAFGPRWVGSAMARCPADVPWHRVVNAQGKISARPGTGSDRQLQRLLAEGVDFSPAGRIDLERFGWQEEVDRLDQPPD